MIVGFALYLLLSAIGARTKILDMSDLAD
jgi:hypothetical protein